MSKSPAIESLLENVAQEFYGRSRTSDCCVQCGSKKISQEDFKDNISWKEFNISRWCQVCQDSFFGGSEFTDPEDD